MTPEIAVNNSVEELGREEKKSLFVHMRATGKSYSQIADKLGVSKSALSNWNAELEEEVASARAIELDALHEEFFMSKERRINLLGEQLKRINAELFDRKMEDIPTDKLFTLHMQYAMALKEEFIETRPLPENEIQELKKLKS
ncbi:helix-turn-helix domain-containing protein [Sneathiella litorea]|uniref:Transposase n=1 Tax=Sneathiella litorea TaxID=2606216 RepID=A0A6L8W593_9PROT|nr:helix-turn-helix domain-containing protein [Sneathiella litorea]MZR29624.1 transposase [Sneathiella litorea]